MKTRYRFIRSGVLLTATALTIKTVGMLFGAYISHAVGAEGVGLYTLIMTVYSFAVTVATSGVSLTVTRLVASAIGSGREGEVSRILRGAMLYALFFGALSSVLLVFGAPIIGKWILSDERTVSAMQVLSLSLIPISFCAVLSGYFVGVKRVAFNAVATILGQGIKIAVTVAMVSYASGYGMVASVGALCASITVTEIISFLIVGAEFLCDKRKYANKYSQKCGNEIKDVVKMAIPLAVSAYIRSIFLSIEHILIPRKLKDRGEDSAEAYSHYGALHGMALPLVLYPMTPLSSFSGLLVPEFAEDMAGGREERMSRVASLAVNTTLSYSVLIAVLLYCFSSELGYLVYNSYDAGSYVAIISPIIPIMYLDHITDQVLKGIGEQVYSMWVNVTDSVLSVLLVWFLIPAFGITGYALVIIIMEGYNFLLSFIRLKKKIRFRINLTESFFAPGVFALASARLANVLFVYSGKDVPAPWLIVKMIFAVCVFLFVKFFIGTLTKIKKANIKAARSV